MCLLILWANPQDVEAQRAAFEASRNEVWRTALENAAVEPPSTPRRVIVSDSGFARFVEGLL